MTTTNTDPRCVLRDLLEDLERNPPDAEQESTPEERAALLAFLQEGVARHALAAKARATHAKVGIIKRREEVPPVLSPREGWYQIVNTSPSFYSVPVDAGHMAPVPPGESFVESDPGGTLAEQIESGSLQVFPPEHRDASWRGTLSQLAWERRAAFASTTADTAALAEALPHVRFELRAEFKTRLDALATVKPAAPTQSGVPQQFRSAHE